MKRRVDVVAANHYSLWLLHPLTRRAQSWFDEHITTDSTWHGDALVVEPRYVPGIVDGLRADGLVVTL